MAEDKTGWSEKGKGSGRGQRSAQGDGAGASESTTPSRPSKRSTASQSSSESTVVRTPSGDGAKKVAKAAATAGQRDVSFASRLGFPALVALVCLLGIGAVVYARSTREALAKPVQNLDHWHAVYGVYNCNLTGEGEAKYMPSFQSTDDSSGIHSHGDGLLHIHPFFEFSSGNNARLKHWLVDMNVDMTTERIATLPTNNFDLPFDLQAGAECADGTGKAEIKVLKWQFDFEALAEVDARPDPEIFDLDLGEIQFDNDREVYILAYVGEDTDLSQIPMPPAERFDILNNVSAQLEFEPESLTPQDSGVEVPLDGDATNTTEPDADEEGDG